MESQQSPLASFVTNIPWKPILQRLPGTWLLTLIPFAFYGPVYLPGIFGAYYLMLHILFFLNNCRSAYGMYISYNSAKMYSTTDWLEKYCKETGAQSGEDTSMDLPYDHVVHVVILPNYKEDMDTLCETLDVLASHRRAVRQYKVSFWEFGFEMKKAQFCGDTALQGCGHGASATAYAHIATSTSERSSQLLRAIANSNRYLICMCAKLTDTKRLRLSHTARARDDTRELRSQLLSDRAWTVGRNTLY
jgi:hypothetical protein